MREAGEVGSDMSVTKVFNVFGNTSAVKSMPEFIKFQNNSEREVFISTALCHKIPGAQF